MPIILYAGGFFRSFRGYYYLFDDRLWKNFRGNICYTIIDKTIWIRDQIGRDKKFCGIFRR